MVDVVNPKRRPEHGQDKREKEKEFSHRAHTP